MLKLREKIKKFLIKKLRSWLEIDKIEHILNWDKERIDFVQSFLKAGLDVNIKEPSWAVICLKGKPEYVQFVNLKSSDFFEIQSFLRHFNRENVVVDNPFFRY